MAIETICSGCAKKLRVGDEHAGKQARCPECGVIYTVPAAVDSSFAAARSTPLPSAAPIEPAPVERWLMKIDDGREFGPVERSVLDQWFHERRIGPTTQLKRDGDAQWLTAAQLYPSLATVTRPAAPANPFADQATYPYPAASPLAGTAAHYAEPHRGGLWLALSLVGWFMGCFFLGAIAWALGASDLAKMRAGQMDPSGEGLTRAGMIIGAIHTVLSIVVLGFLALIFIGAALGN